MPLTFSVCVTVLCGIVSAVSQDVPKQRPFAGESENKAPLSLLKQQQPDNCNSDKLSNVIAHEMPGNGAGRYVASLRPVDKTTKQGHRQARDILSQTDDALYADEPRYLVIRRRPYGDLLLEPRTGFPESFNSFIPQRGRRQLTIEQMLEKGDYFVPNRGKKGIGSEMSKKIKFDDILGTDEYFYPNRGKKSYFGSIPYDLGADSTGGLEKRNILNAMQNDSPRKNVDGELFFPTRGKRREEARLRRNILENLANENKDTFFSSRGKRLPVAWKLLTGHDDPLQDYIDGMLTDIDNNGLGLPLAKPHTSRETAA